MKNLKLFKDLASAVGEFVNATPNVTVVKDVDSKSLYIPYNEENDDDFVYTSDDDFINYKLSFVGPHGGMTAKFNFDGTNNIIGRYKLYNRLKELYLDGEIYDLDDLVVTAVSGSASASGSGGAMNDIAFPETVTGVHKVEYVLELDSDGTIDISGNGWFKNCSGITKVTLPNFIDEINCYTFYGCENITTVYSDAECVFVHDDSYYNNFNGRFCGVNTGYYHIPSCPVTNVVIGDSITSVCDKAFRSCKSLTSIEIPDSVTSIGESAFDGCTGLTSIEIPDSVTSIGSSAFYGCTGLTSIEIPNSVTSIGSSAFYGCTSLTSVKIPNSVTSIGSYAFRGCTGLTSITVDSGNTAYNDGNGSNCIILISTNTLICGCKNTVIPSSVTSIGSFAFCQCTGLTSIEIPDSVTSISSSAFYGCTSLTSIDIPSLVTEIGYSVFLGCTGLRSIVIPNSVTSIGNYAFRDCTGLTSIDIPDSVNSIGDYAFFGCTGLTSIEIPDSVSSIGNDAFYSCNLTSLIIDSNALMSNVNSISSSFMYKFNTQLKTVIIGDSVTSIGSYAFYGCTGLTSIDIPSSVTHIGSLVFYGCTGLTSIEIPSSVTSIGSNAFYNVAKVIYNGSATGSPWGAKSVVKS